MSRALVALFLAFLAVGCLLGCSPTYVVHDVPNLAKVSDGIWRGGQPQSLAGWQYLQSLGVHRVVKLNFESEGSDDDARSLGMQVVYLPIQPEGDQNLWSDIEGTFVKPDASRIALAAQWMAASQWMSGGVYVHCTHGQDRTGTAVGRFRVVFEGMTKRQAWDEAIAHGFHPELVGLVRYWLEDMPDRSGR